MKTYKDTAIVIRTQKLGDSDRIITLFCRENGVVRAVAKGVRKTKSKFGSSLEPFQQVNLMLYRGKSLDTVTQSQIIFPYAKNLSEYEKYTVAMTLVEVCEKMSRDNAGVNSEEQFMLLAGALNALASSNLNPKSVLNAYIIRTISLSGWQPFLDSCAICSKSVGKIEEGGFGIFFSNVSGGVTCSDHKSSDAQRIYFSDLRYMFALLNYDWKTAGGADAREINSATILLDSYFKYHVEKRITSLRFV